MRVAIVNSDGFWFIRRIRSVEHDLERDEKVYRCDEPIGPRFGSPEEAVRFLRRLPEFSEELSLGKGG